MGISELPEQGDVTNLDPGVDEGEPEEEEFDVFLLWLAEFGDLSYAPGSEERVTIYRIRYLLGMSMWHPKDKNERTPSQFEDEYRD